MGKSTISMAIFNSYVTNYQSFFFFKLSIGFGNSKLGGKCWWKSQEARLKSCSDRFSLIKFWTACDCLQFPGSRMNESTRHLIHRPSNLIIDWFDHSIKEYNAYIYIELSWSIDTHRWIHEQTIVNQWNQSTNALVHGQLPGWVGPAWIRPGCSQKTGPGGKECGCFFFFFF